MERRHPNRSFLHVKSAYDPFRILTAAQAFEYRNAMMHVFLCQFSQTDAVYAHGDDQVFFGQIFDVGIDMDTRNMTKPRDFSGTFQHTVQKSAFLASEDTVNYEVVFQKKFSSGLFGGEGFIMQRLSGRGIVFVEIDGELIEYQLAAGQQIVVDTGNVAGYEETVQMDIQSVKGIKNKLFGGEGLFNTVLTGPGKILLQTMPVSGMAQILIPYMPTSSSN